MGIKIAGTKRIITPYSGYTFHYLIYTLHSLLKTRLFKRERKLFTVFILNFGAKSPNF